MTDKISEFLTKFDDQHLANLQAAAEDGTLVYHNCERCFVHHFEGNYSFTKWEGQYAALARDAEVQYAMLAVEFPAFYKAAEAQRRKAILPLIQAEWARRSKPDPVVTLPGPGTAWIEECEPIEMLR